MAFQPLATTPLAVGGGAVAVSPNRATHIQTSDVAGIRPWVTASGTSHAHASESVGIRPWASSHDARHTHEAGRVGIRPHIAVNWGQHKHFAEAVRCIEQAVHLHEADQVLLSTPIGAEDCAHPNVPQETPLFQSQVFGIWDSVLTHEGAVVYLDQTYVHRPNEAWHGITSTSPALFQGQLFRVYGSWVPQKAEEVAYSQNQFLAPDSCYLEHEADKTLVAGLNDCIPHPVWHATSATRAGLRQSQLLEIYGATHNHEVAPVWVHHSLDAEDGHHDIESTDTSFLQCHTQAADETAHGSTSGRCHLRENHVLKTSSVDHYHDADATSFDQTPVIHPRYSFIRFRSGEAELEAGIVARKASMEHGAEGTPLTPWVHCEDAVNGHVIHAPDIIINHELSISSAESGHRSDLAQIRSVIQIHAAASLHMADLARPSPWITVNKSSHEQFADQPLLDPDPLIIGNKSSHEQFADQPFLTLWIKTESAVHSNYADATLLGVNVSLQDAYIEHVAQKALAYDFASVPAAPERLMLVGSERRTLEVPEEERRFIA